MDRLFFRSKKFLRNTQAELSVIHPRLWLLQILMAPLPLYFGSRFRARLLASMGFDIGSGTVFWGKPTITGTGNIYPRLHIGRDCWINAECFLDLGSSIFIGDRVSVGHQVIFLTSSHQLGTADRRAGPPMSQPIQVGNGVWLGTRCTILPGITIHDGAVVAAGAVVTKDVPPNVIVGGAPARIIRYLDEALSHPVSTSLSEPELLKSL
jgi:maltose O-acetyltransferase